MVCRKLNHFSACEFTRVTKIVAGYWKVRGFQETQVNLDWVNREIRYHVPITELLKRNLMNQVAELFPRPKDMLKILSRDHQFFQKSPGIKFLYDWGKELFNFMTG